MTEEEAKTKWCPMSRSIHVGRLMGGSYASPTNKNAEHSRCIASDCMMWRKRTWFNEESQINVGAGYCGLAGTP